MIKKILFGVLFMSFVTSCKKKQDIVSLLSSGISKDLAIYRKQQVDQVVYNISFNIPRDKKERIESQLNLELNIKDLQHPLYLDFNDDQSRLKHVLVNGEDISINHKKEHLIIAQDYLKMGSNTIRVLFNAGELSLNRNEDYLYTLLVPDRASTLFPCFDQPNIKAHYKLDITAPKDWEVLCGSYIEKQENQGDFINYKFKKSDRMSTYLFSFVAGDFNKTNQKHGELNMQMLYRENNKEKLVASTDAIFKLHNESVLFFEDYTQYKFPFQKLDFAVIPGFQYGGMEHVGAIQYRETSLFLDSTATQNQKLNRSGLIAHETAHMWFGDLVTMQWFDDVWLKEVFANFLADKVTQKSFPDVNHTLNFMSDNYARAYSEDRTKGATPIRQELDNLKNAGTLYGRIIYNKAPIMMRQLEALVGEKGFRKGMQNYIKKYADNNADWNDLVSILDKQTPEDLKTWSAVWVKKPGRPIISDSVIYKNNTIKHFEISQKAENGSDQIWPQIFNIGLVYKDSVKVVPVKLTAKQQDLVTLVGLPKPEFVVYNYDAFGYGVFPIDNAQLNAIPKINDDIARGYAYINLYENVLSGYIKPYKALSVFEKGVSLEKNELVLGTIIIGITSLFWNYISETERNSFGADLEKVVYKQLQKDAFSPSYKKTLFDLYKNIAYSEQGKSTLYTIWNTSESIKGLNLNEYDYTRLAAILAIYNHAKADTILKTALKNITNPDRKKRFEFLMPTLSKEENVRDRFVLSLAKAKNREKEAWVSTGLNYVNHPLRQNSAKKHLKMYLELLEDIQVTGDIFFPKSWLNATIGNYSSEYAYNVLEQFLADNPDFSIALKNKLLQSSDGLYRAKLIRETYP